MSNIDLIVKENDNQKVFLSENTIDVLDILEKYYPYIYESMNEEGFILKYEQCNLFKEMVYERKVVGFCTYDFSREFITAAISNIYVLPEFRGNGLFLEEIKRTMAEHNKPSIMEPTRLVVELLVEYGFACKIDDSIVASAIEFIVPGNNVLSNGDYANDELSTHFYDLSICASIHILDIDKAHIAYSSPLNYDIIHYDCLDARNDMDDDYFLNLTQMFRENDVRLMNTVLELQDRLHIKKYSLEEIIGDDDTFSFYIDTMIDDAHVTREKAFKIKNQIREEYEAGMILNESLLIRLAYLFNENPEPTITSHEEICPYCSMPVDSHDRFCHFCGINLEFDPNSEENFLFNYLKSSNDEFTEDIRFIAYKFLSLISQNIETEYSIFTIENTYNIDWKELKSFLTENDYFKNNQITSEGLKFLKSHPLYFWEKYHMEVVNYTDFENYFYSSKNSNPQKICLDYLKQFSDDEYIVEIIDEIKKDCSDN